MPEHLPVEDIERLRHRAMPSAELINAYEHLAVCVACRRRVSEAAQPQQAFTSLLAGLESEEPEHLPYEQVAAYVDDGLDEVDREIASSHLEWCAPCALRVQELRALKAELASPPPKAQTLAASPTAWQRYFAFWRLPAHWIPLQIALTAALIVIAVGVATYRQRTRIAELQVARDQLKQSNDALQKQAAGMAEAQARIAELEAKNEKLQQDYKQAKTSVDDLQARLIEAQRIQTQAARDSAHENLIALNDNGRRVVLNERGEIIGLASLSPAEEQSVKKALTAQELDTPTDLAELAVGSASLVRGTAKGVAFALSRPVGIIVQSDHPTFHWQGLSGASGYIVTVFDSSFNRVASSDLLAQTEWTIPSALERGKTYSWQVTAIKGNAKINSPTTPAPEARFRVLEASSAIELERASQTYHNSHLLLGILYTRAGLLDEAEGEFQALVSANPQSAVARNLLRRIKRLRRNGTGTTHLPSPTMMNPAQ